MKGPVLTTTTSGIPIFQEILTTAQGGFTLDDSALTVGSTIKAGTAIGIDEATRKVKVAKSAVLQASATNVATTYRVLKGHNLVVGMTVNLPGGTGRAITVIDPSNPSYDEFTVGTTIGVAANAGIMLAVADIGTTAPNGLLLEDVLVDTNAEISVVTRGVVYHRRIPPVAAATKLLMPNIIFSESY